MDWWQALWIGIVEGLTEYLPVSSTGHILLTQRLIGVPEGEAANAFAIAVQAGAILAVLGLFRARVGRIFKGLAGSDPEGRRLGLQIVVAFLPAAVFGLAFDDKIEEYLFGMRPIVWAWLVGGLGILAVARWRRGKSPASGRSLFELSYRGALIIGLLQCLAMWPGTSRSLMTIVGGLAVGLEMAAAVEFSFLLGLVTLGAATAYKTLGNGALMLDTYGPVALFVGFLASWIAAVLSVRWMVSWLKSHGLAVFGWYRVVLAAVVYVALLR
jgi:undecaprenyl-diphosphatase